LLKASCNVSRTSFASQPSTLLEMEARIEMRMPRSVLQPEQRLLAAGPTLNCDDLPEVKIVGRQRNARSGRRTDRVENRVKALEFSADLETLLDSDEDWAALDQEIPREGWTCQACTFLNHEIMSTCEVCNARKEATSTSQQLVCQHSAAYDPSGEWPPLQDTQDSWVHDEVSSVGSSWLDICGSADCEADGSEASFSCITFFGVKQISSDTRQRSWATRVGIASPNEMLPETRLGGIVVPLSWQRPASVKRPKRKEVQEFDGDDNVELTELENRRMFPASTRGMTQRLRGTSPIQIPWQSKRSVTQCAASLGTTSTTPRSTMSIGAKGVVQKSKEAKMKAAFANIGVFADYAGTLGADFLEHGEPSCLAMDTEVVQAICAQFGIAPGGCFKMIPTVLLESDERKMLMRELDARCDGESDLKLALTEEELGHLIGPSHVARLVALLPHGVDQIYLRRCAAHGKFIRFHVDEAVWTLQVPLNDPDGYRGGKLVYATKDGRLACPHRAAGTATLHDSAMLHGVTQLESGVRYSLYFLQLEAELQ